MPQLLIASTDKDGLQNEISGIDTSQCRIGNFLDEEQTAFLIFDNFVVDQGALLEEVRLRPYAIQRFKATPLIIRTLLGNNVSSITNGDLPFNEVDGAIPTSANAIVDQVGDGADTGFTVIDGYLPNADSVNHSADAAVGYDVTALAQEVVNQPGWVSGNSICFSIDRGTDFPLSSYASVMILSDYSDSSSDVALLDYTVSTLPTVTSPDILEDGSTGVVITGTNLTAISSVELTDGVTSVSQTFSEGTASQFTMDVSRGGLPYGSGLRQLEIVVTTSEGVARRDISLQPQSGYSYVDIANPLDDPTSIFYNATNANPGDQLLYQNALLVSIDDRGVPTYDPSVTEIVVQHWESVNDTWSSWVTFPVDGNVFQGNMSSVVGEISANFSGEINISGSLNASLEDVNSSFGNVINIDGNLSSSLEDVTLSGSGSHYMSVGGNYVASLADVMGPSIEVGTVEIVPIPDLTLLSNVVTVVHNIED